MTSNPHLLIIDDEESFREDTAELFRLRGFECSTAGDIITALHMLADQPLDAILCDVVMPGGGALALLKSLEPDQDAGVFVMTAFGNLDSAMGAFRAGAVDFFLKPLNLDEVETKIRRYRDNRARMRRLSQLRGEIQRGLSSWRILGESSAMQQVRQTVEKVAATRSSVLITGETGVGKEVVARAIHAASPWHENRFVAVNCAAFPGSLLESELFGHERGSFTGAISRKVGLIEAAAEGTLLLDEISELHLSLQAKLLRAVEERRVKPIGATSSKPINIRLLASTNRDLMAEVEAGRFRGDLLYRLKVIEVVVPPLREHREDIPALASHFLEHFSRDIRRAARAFSPEATRLMHAYGWPGNVRELRNVVERAVILSRGEVLDVDDLPESIAGAQPLVEIGDDLRTALKHYEVEHIRAVLARCGGNKRDAALRLGIDPSTLYRKLE